MKVQDRIINSISLLKFKDKRIIQNIVYHPLLFAKRRMTDPDDERPIRIRYFGVFTQKYLHNKTSAKQYRFIRDHIEDPLVMAAIRSLNNEIVNTESAYKWLYYLYNANKKDQFDKLYNIICKAIGE